MLETSTIPALEQVLRFTETRNGILAGNIANMDVPGYQARDLSVNEFQEALAEALDSRWERRSQASEGRSVASQIDMSKDAMRRVDESMKGVLHHDGSNVSLEQQIAAVSKNQSLYNLAVALMSQQFSLLETAISERV